MGLLDWFRRRRKEKIGEEKWSSAHQKLQTEIEKRVKKEPKKRKRKKERA
ncbi:MAG: hypothetical protein JSV15_04605 [Candidatus Bathyarchaeota archaeon]|jgi:hypothetical protein|nr:MAG: hypothetical protein JSV15_04605 [Candidatus Bathyarchaeota archaeon]